MEKFSSKPTKSLKSVTCPSFASAIALLAGCTVLAGCAVEAQEFDSTNGSIAAKSQNLIGGHHSAPYHFRSTVGIAGRCSAAKVGTHLFLTAAHCVESPRGNIPGLVRREDGLAEDFVAGEQIVMNYGLEPADGQEDEVTIVETHIHPSWLNTDTINPSKGWDGSAADIAVVQIAEATPQIPEATVELGSVPVGSHVVKLGWGCQESAQNPGVGLQRYKTEDAWIVPVDHVDHEQNRGRFFSDPQLASIDDTYLITAGHDQGEQYASLCPGDSGGPLYIPNNTERRVVGVNADYTFLPQGEAGVSWTDWHTKTSLNSSYSIGEWLVAFGVNTAGGQLPQGEGAITMERWNNVGGTSVSQVPIYRPSDSENNIENFEIYPDSSDNGDNYGVRLRGFLIPPVSGTYMFWIAGDDNASLRLSTDEHSYHAVEIAHHSGYTANREWDKYPSQESSGIYLVAGSRYYIEANMKEAGGNDNLAVGWNLPGQEGKPQIVPGAQLSPLVEGSTTCTCPDHCDAVQSESAPFTVVSSGAGCYFIENLGSSVNSFGMNQVDLNGQNITNQWVGAGSYPSQVDGGYYLYVGPQYPWAQVQVQ